MGRRKVTFKVSGTSSGGAGWIGRTEDHRGVFFAHSQEYITDDEHMIEALEKSGVAWIISEDPPDEEAIGTPGAEPVIDDTPVVDKPLKEHTNEELRIMCVERGIKIPSRKNKATYIEAIEATLADE